MEAEKTNRFGLKLIQGNLQRTELRSLPLEYSYLLCWILLLGTIMGLETIYKKSFLEFTLSKDGIYYQQTNLPQMWQKFFLIETNMGGGKELIALSFYGFLLKDRPKAIYYWAVFTLEKLFSNFYKLAYADPRPYMIDKDI
jgi:hypothetical protein